MNHSRSTARRNYKALLDKALRRERDVASALVSSGEACSGPTVWLQDGPDDLTPIAGPRLSNKSAVGVEKIVVGLLKQYLEAAFSRGRAFERRHGRLNPPKLDPRKKFRRVR